MATPPFSYQDTFPLGADDTEYRLLSKEGISTTTFEGREILKVDPGSPAGKLGLKPEFTTTEWSGILAGLLLSFARALGEFGATLMVAGSIAGKTQTLSIAVYEAVQAGQDDTANFLVAVTSITCLAVLLSAGKLLPGRVPARG